MTERLRECEAALRAALSGDFAPAESYLALDALGGEQRGTESELFVMAVGALKAEGGATWHWSPHRPSVVTRIVFERPDARLRLQCIAGNQIVAGLGRENERVGVSPFFLQQGHYAMRVRVGLVFQIQIANPTTEEIDVGQMVAFGRLDEGPE